MKNQIESVDPGSPAARAGIHPGECLLEINGKPIIDVLDYKFYGYDRKLTLLLEKAGKKRRVTLRKAEGEDLGLNFATYLMDKARSCANRCIFCFVDQMPKGMRETLYFKDDDARLSFLLGNYITMTNLSQREIERICALRLSPINISVHATDPEVRIQMLGNRRAGHCLEIMQQFAAAGITMNCQIVACPGINDGAVLQRTMEDLSALYPAVNSVSIVPVGLTKYREGLFPLHAYTGSQADSLLDQVERFAACCQERLGSSVFWCSDEFYLLAGRELPAESYYEGFFQLENGVGMLRLLESEALFAWEDYENSPAPAPFSIATGTAAAPFFRALLEKTVGSQKGVQFFLYPIQNHFFGEQVNVTGLITGGDLIAQLQGKALGQRLLISENMLRHGENVFLDDVTLPQVEEALGVPVFPVAQDGGAFLQAIFEKTHISANHMAVPPVGREEEFYRYNPSKE